MNLRKPQRGFGDDRQTCDLCHDWHEPARYDPVLGMAVCRKCREELESEPESGGGDVSGPYSHLMIDPPWPKRKGGLRKVAPGQTRKLGYETLPVSEIFTILQQDVFSQASSNACVWLWTVDEFLWAAENEMEARGWKRHARLIWDKGNGVAPAFTQPKAGRGV